MTRILRRFGFIRVVWIGAATLVTILMAICDPIFAEEAETKLSVVFDDEQITVEAKNVKLDRILKLIGAHAEFVVDSTHSDNPSPMITGRRTGDLEDILEWLLRTQNHILLYDKMADDSVQANAKLARILLMRPPVRRPSVDWDTVEPIRSGGPLAGEVGDSGDEMREPDGFRARFAGLVSAEAPAGPGAPAQDVPQSPATSTKVAQRLNTSGKRLANIIIDPRHVDIVRTIDLAGDVPLATYVMTHQAAGPSLQRTELGNWVPWDGHGESLIDNRFTSSNGRLTFEVIKGDLFDEFFPITFTIAYRTKEDLKFGIFQAMPNQSLQE